eukprot:365693-Chlamydomonas_euryale.AAC.17
MAAANEGATALRCGRAVYYMCTTIIGGPPYSPVRTKEPEVAKPSPLQISANNGTGHQSLTRTRLPSQNKGSFYGRCLIVLCLMRACMRACVCACVCECVRACVGMKLTDRHRLQTTREQCGTSSLELMVRRRTLQWMRGVLRMDEDRLPRQALVAH